MEKEIEIPRGNTVLIYTSPEKRIYYRIYHHKDAILDNILVTQRINPLEKGSKGKTESWIIEKDFQTWLTYLKNAEGYNEIKIETQNAIENS